MPLTPRHIALYMSTPEVPFNTIILRVASVAGPPTELAGTTTGTQSFTFRRSQRKQGGCRREGVWGRARTSPGEMP